MFETSVISCEVSFSSSGRNQHTQCLPVQAQLSRDEGGVINFQFCVGCWAYVLHQLCLHISVWFSYHCSSDGNEWFCWGSICGIKAPLLASISARSLTAIPVCPGTQYTITLPNFVWGSLTCLSHFLLILLFHRRLIVMIWPEILTEYLRLLFYYLR